MGRSRARLSTTWLTGMVRRPSVSHCVHVRTRTPWAAPNTPFTAAQVAPLGITEKRIRSALAAGAITRLRRGVYISTGAVPEDPALMHLLRALAEQVAAPNRVASHDTAALAHGLPLLSTRLSAAGPVHLTRPRSSSDRSRVAPGRRLHLGELPQHHVVTLPSALVATTPARTAVDLALSLPLPVGLMSADAAARAEFEQVAGSLARRHYGNHRLRSAALVPLHEAVEHVQDSGRRAHLSTLMGLVDPRRESPLESFSSGHMHLAGLPAPVLQAQVRTGSGVYAVDYLWEEFGVIGEADGEVKYSDPHAFIVEKEREGHLRDIGYEVVRWTGSLAFRAPREMTDRIERTLSNRGWRQ